MATLKPVGGACWGMLISPLDISQSATKRSMRPMATGSCLTPVTQTFSHWSSCGQTRPQMAGRVLSFLMIARASSKRWSWMACTKAGMSMPTGQPEMHLGFLHARQRSASATASSGVKPRATSLKLRIRSMGSWAGIA